MSKNTNAGITWQQCDGVLARELLSVTNATGHAVSAGFYQNSTGSYASVVRRTDTGALSWSRLYGGSQSSPTFRAFGVSSDVNGTAYASGLNGTAKLHLPSDSVYSLVLTLKDAPFLTSVSSLKYLANGDLDWAVEYAGLLNDIGLANTLDSLPHLIVVGAEMDNAGLIVHPLIVRYENL